MLVKDPKTTTKGNFLACVHNLRNSHKHADGLTLKGKYCDYQIYDFIPLFFVVPTNVAFFSPFPFLFFFFLSLFSFFSRFAFLQRNVVNIPQRDLVPPSVESLQRLTDGSV